jgi:lipopolysaccharide/colanic/teichoic acid biosynthesis glycosyltransferase
LGTIPLFRRAVVEEHSCWQIVCVCERAAALPLLILTLPVTLISALIIRILSGRTPLIAHRRVGRNGATLWVLKLRTMWDPQAGGEGHSGVVEYIDDEGGPECKLENDPRVPGRFPQFLRRHSIDELPQLWHVIWGEMSLVGPRPLTERELRKHYGVHCGEVLRVRPGLAGLWQISGRNRLSYADRQRLDIEFVRNRTFGMYFRILLRTVPEVLRGQNSW